MKKFGLGNGLDALLPLSNVENPPADTEGGVLMLSLDDIVANPNQPRKTFDDEELAELAETIKSHGVLQPIVVEQVEDEKYMLVMGERRTRAARLAGLLEIPAMVRRFTPEESITVALIENIQRATVNPIEEALAYKHLMDMSGLSQDAAASRVGKNRATFANAIRLLKLPPSMQDALRKGDITAGHARALLSIEKDSERYELFAKIKNEALTVREAERYATGGGLPPPAPVVVPAGMSTGTGTSTGMSTGATAHTAVKDLPPTPTEAERQRSNSINAEMRAIEQRLIELMGTRVRIEGDFSKGTIKIEYYSKDDLERLYNLIME
jgi:ParB family chromosome partitioning protein